MSRCNYCHPPKTKKALFEAYEKQISRLKSEIKRYGSMIYKVKIGSMYDPPNDIKNLQRNIRSTKETLKKYPDDFNANFELEYGNKRLEDLKTKSVEEIVEFRCIKEKIESIGKLDNNISIYRKLKSGKMDWRKEIERLGCANCYSGDNL